MDILSIETSCDDTCVAVVRDGKTIRSNIVSSQYDFHRRFGGVVPEVASRKHLEFLIPVLDEACSEAQVSLSDIDGIVATRGPGLSGSLLMGLCLAKTIAILYHKPFYAVNHLEGHLFASTLNHPELEPPFISLIVSGGHTELIIVRDWGRYESWGKTRDDAAGEVYDKISKYLNIGFPGGPLIDIRSRGGNPSRFHFRGGLEDDESPDFSFSGLKTAVTRTFQAFSEEEKHDEVLFRDLLASFQESVVRTLWKKTLRVVERTGYCTIALGGGVAANSYLRERFQAEGEQYHLRVFFPSRELCTDNAAMIGACGSFHLFRGERSSLATEPDSQLSLA